MIDILFWIMEQMMKKAGSRITSILEDPDRMKYDSMIKDLLKNNELILK